MGAEESKVKRSASEEMEGAPRSKVVKREEVTVLKAEDRDVEMKDVGGKVRRFRRMIFLVLPR